MRLVIWERHRAHYEVIVRNAKSWFASEDLAWVVSCELKVYVVLPFIIPCIFQHFLCSPEPLYGFIVHGHHWFRQWLGVCSVMAVCHLDTQDQNSDTCCSIYGNFDSRNIYKHVICLLLAISCRLPCVNPLWFSDVIMTLVIWSTVVQIVACCLTTIRH